MRKKLLSFNSMLNIFLMTLGTLHFTSCQLMHWWVIENTPERQIYEHQNVTIQCIQNDFIIEEFNSSIDWFRNEKVVRFHKGGRYSRMDPFRVTIEDVRRVDSGLYSCYHTEKYETLLAAGILNILVPIKHVNLTHYPEKKRTPKDYDETTIKCCVNGDAYPSPQFKWNKISLNNHESKSGDYEVESVAEITKVDSTLKEICSDLDVKVTRVDNVLSYSCSVINEATQEAVVGKIEIEVQYKPEVFISLNGRSLNEMNEISLIEKSSYTLFCNSTSIPRTINFEWFFNDKFLTNEQTLNFYELDKTHAGVYRCRSTNINGYTDLSIKIDLLYTNLVAMNKTNSKEFNNGDLRQLDAIYISARENDTITLGCELNSNPSIDRIVWNYYELSSHNQLLNRQIIRGNSTQRIVKNHTQMSMMTLSNVSFNNTGYYICFVKSKLKDNFGNIRLIEQEQSYYLNILSSPVISDTESISYGKINEIVYLNCEVHTNPVGNITWFFNDNAINDGRVKNFRSKFNESEPGYTVVSELKVFIYSQSDFGSYQCQSSNIIGTSDNKITNLVPKTIPYTPGNFHVNETLSNSIRLFWDMPPFTGENVTFVLNINKDHNLTMYSAYINQFDHEHQHIVISGLEPNTMYSFKILAYNTIGSSRFSNVTHIKTLPAKITSVNLPFKIGSALYDDIQEAICFEIENHGIKASSNLIARLNIVNTADFQIYNGKLNELNSEPILFNVEGYRLLGRKKSECCILYSQITKLRYNQNMIILSNAGPNLYLNNFNGPKIKAIGKSFHEFKNRNRINVSLCLAENTIICSKQIRVDHSQSILSIYMTLAAVCTILLLVCLFMLAVKMFVLSVKSISKQKRVDSKFRRNVSYNNK